MKWTNEVECQRTNVTPKEFYRYALRYAEKKGMKDYFPVENYIDWENPPCPCKPYYTEDKLERLEMQPFNIHIWRKSEFNMILEFDFYDEKRGFGYIYLAENQSE